MSNKDIINVYWAPSYIKNKNNPEDWSMLYSDPMTLFNKLKNKRDISSKDNTFLTCPATTKFFKKTYVFENNIDCKYEYDFDKKNIIIPTQNNYLGFDAIRPNSIVDGPLIRFNLGYVFFSDQPLLTTFSGPTFSKPGYTKYGSPVPGQFDIGQWFRPFNIELQMWSNSGKIEFVDGEDLFYATFNTDKNINLSRFYLDETLWSYINHCVDYKSIFGPFKDLNERYKKFKKSRMSEMILKQIKKNIIGETNG